MTRKHFAAIAAALSAARPFGAAKGSDSWAQWEHDVRSVAQVLRTSNVRFDVERLARVCGVES